MANLAKTASVKCMYLNHVDPQRPDDDPVGLDNMRAVFPHTEMAEDLMEIEF